MGLSTPRHLQTKGWTTVDEGSTPKDRFAHSAQAERQRRKDGAQEFLAARPLRGFLLIQLAWGCVGALLGLLLGSWVSAVAGFIVFAGSGLIGREVIRRRHAADAPQARKSPTSDA